MTPQETLDRYRHLVVVNSQRIALQLSQLLQKVPREQASKMMVRNRTAGCFWLFRDPNVLGTALECVVSPAGGDSVTSLYKDCSEIATPGALLDMRTHLIEALATRVGLSVEAVGIQDQTRGRLVGLNELATGQLLDLLAEQLGSGLTLASNSVVSNSHGVDLDVAALAMKAA